MTDLSDDTASRFLNCLRRSPGLVNVPRGEVLQDGQITSGMEMAINEVSARECCF